MLLLLLYSLAKGSEINELNKLYIASQANIALKRISKSIISLLLFLFLAQLSWGAHTSFVFSYLEDKEGIYSLEEIAGGDFADKFQQSQMHAHGFGIIASHFWIKLEFEQSEAFTEEHYLILENQLLDKIEVFVERKENYESIGRAGAKVPHKDWAISSNVPVFELLPTDLSSAIYLRISVSTLSNLPIRLLGAREYFEAEGKDHTLMGIFFGILCLFLLYNSLIYVRFRARIFLFYIPFILLVFLCCTIFSGYAYRFFWPSFPAFNYIAPEFATSLITTVAVLLAAFVLRVEELFPRLKHTFRILAILPTLLLGISFFLPKPLTVRLFNSVPQLIMIFLVVLSFFSWRKGNRAALFFFLGWISLFFGVLIFILKDFGLLPFTFITEHIILLSILIDILMFSIAMGEIVSQSFAKRQESALKLKQLSLEVEFLKKQVQLHGNTDVELPLERINLYLEDALSNREMEVLELLISGKKNKEISEALFISENTIKKHVSSIYRKLEVKNRAQLSTKAITLANHKK
ncbi:MAG: 7TM diverse intracellular signaling domain-containing protein [Bacteroidia bacterium]|nr:7TM diverse intracellular signaling domain-containing protein [Bacteroidia bacterium]